jgi:uncharacterized membrane protein YeaQ/YmgE (transglycosylase-associated protein family)
MNFVSFAERTQIWPRFRRAMLIFWLPLVLLAVIPVVIVLLLGIPTSIISIITIIVIGFIAGVIAHLLVAGHDPQSFVLSTVLGIVGAFTGTFVGEIIGLFRHDHLFGAMIGAFIFLIVWVVWSRTNVGRLRH